jgi:NADPH2:quinone reductase
MDGMVRTVIARQFGDIQNLEVVDLLVAQPETGQVRIAVRAAAVNPADVKQLRGMFGGKTFPLRLGSEVSGVVTAVGPDAIGPAGPIAVGDEVVGYPVRGGFAAELIAKADSVLPKPTGLGWGQAAGLLVGAVTAFHLVESVAVAAGDRVIVHGATGNVGLAVVQLARLRGAEVIGTVSGCTRCCRMGRMSRSTQSAPTRPSTPPWRSCVTGSASRPSPDSRRHPLSASVCSVAGREPTRAQRCAPPRDS